jgi:hypothetical protein
VITARLEEIIDGANSVRVEHMAPNLYKRSLWSVHPCRGESEIDSP